MSAPLKEDMRGVDGTDKERTSKTATEAIPKGGQNDWQVIQSLIDIVQKG
jgi:hypothetical protein